MVQRSSDQGYGRTWLMRSAWPTCASLATQARGLSHEVEMQNEIRAIARARWRVAIALSAAVFLLYFGFILAVAFAKDAMAVEVVPGLTWGILFGAIVIVGAWATTWIYVSWANRHFDARLSRLGAGEGRP